VIDEPIHFLDLARGGKGPLCGARLRWPRYDLLTIRTDLVTCRACLDQLTKYLGRARNTETLAGAGPAGGKDGPKGDSRRSAPKRGGPADRTDE
jgi:hypothetical protein